MKYIISIAALIFIAAFTTKNTDSKNLATVNQEQGLYVFADSRPTQEFKVIGTLKSSRVNVDLKSFVSYDLSYEELKDEIFRQIGKKKNSQKYAEAEGIIIYPDKQKADLIKFQ